MLYGHPQEGPQFIEAAIYSKSLPLRLQQSPTRPGPGFRGGMRASIVGAGALLLVMHPAHRDMEKKHGRL